MSESPQPAVSEVRSVTIALSEGQLLLPNAAIAEVTDYSEPQLVTGAPDWLLGTVMWRQRSVPVIAFERLLSRPFGIPGHRARIAVCHALRNDARRPFIGIVSASIPHLLRLGESNLVPRELDATDAEAPVLGSAEVGGVVSWIPDLDRLQDLVGEIL